MGITMKIKLKQVFLFLYLFYFMYAPSIGNGTSILFTNYMLSIILLAFVLLIECRKVAGKVLCQLRNRRIALFFIGIVIASVYYMSRVLTSRVYYQGIEDLRIVQNGIVFVYLIHALVIVSIFKNWNYSFEDAWKFIFRVAALQGVICVLMFLVPSFKNIANIIFANYSGFRIGDYIMLTRICRSTKFQNWTFFRRIWSFFKFCFLFFKTSAEQKNCKIDNNNCFGSGSNSFSFMFQSIYIPIFICIVSGNL